MAKVIAKSQKVKVTDEQQVEAHMQALKHPLKKEMELLRKIIKSVDAGIKERVKWNAPSYYFVEDIVTFGPARDARLLLIFHHPHIDKVKSRILEGEYKGRRLAYFSSMSEIKSNKKEVERIVYELVKSIKQKSK